uniref:Uncharacterized protein n=1 Tax=Tanacetum cinerariifolium TaxID=118510 RepID=A0A699JHV7_TANCI|nr:hypothetical protein [Tanacetum cinerariifolium]
MNQHRVILPIFSAPTRNNTRILRTNRIRLPQVHKTQILPRNRILILERKCHPRSSLSFTIGVSSTATIQYGNYSNPRNAPPQFISQQSSQPQFFRQPQFKVPQAKDPRDGRCRPKKRKQPVVDLDEGDDDNMAEKRAITR